MARMTRRARLRGGRRGGPPGLLLISFVLLAGVAAFARNGPAFVGALAVGALLVLTTGTRPARRRR